MRWNTLTRHRRMKAGITFIEIMFAAIVLAVALLPIIQSSTQNVRRTGFNIYRTTATMLINQLMERHRTMSYSHLQERFGAGEIDMAESLQNDPVLSSPFVSAEYKAMLQDKYTVTASFEDISENDTMGLLHFNVTWKASAKSATSNISLARTVINYEKFGIQTMGTQSSFLDPDGNPVGGLNGSTGASPSYSGSQGGSSTPPVTISDPLQAIQLFGSAGC